MASDVFTGLAVSSLAAYLRTAYPAALRTLEAELSLADHALPDPDEVVEANTPADNRNIVLVFEMRADPVEQRAGIERWDVDCTVGLAYAGDADIVASTTVMRRCCAAMRRCLRADPTLAGTVIHSLVTDFEGGVVRGDASAIRHAAAFGVTVRLNTL